MTALTLPTLGNVPARFVVPSDATWARDLLLALHDGGAVLPEDFVGRPRTLGDLLKNVLRRQWLEITRGQRIFRWNLGVSYEERHWLHGRNTATWLMINVPGDADSNWPCPTFYLSENMLRLEAVAEGLGQTVLAVFYDALRYLPNTLTPQDSFWQMQFTQWGGFDSETEYAEEIAEQSGLTPDEVLQRGEVYRRSDFFSAMPEWAVSPRRRLTDAQVRQAARRDRFASAVVDAVDAVVRAVHHRGVFADCSCRDAEADSIGWIAWFRWSPFDEAPRFLDDWANEVVHGEYIEAATAVCCEPEFTNPVAWLSGMRNTARVARQVETLVDLIATPSEATERVMVQVRA